MSLKDRLADHGWVLFGIAATIAAGVGAFVLVRIGLIRSMRHPHEPIPDIGVYVAGLSKWQRRDLRNALRGRRAPGHVHQWISSQDENVVQRLKHALSV